jgi:hypothetical protein
MLTKELFYFIYEYYLDYSYELLDQSCYFLYKKTELIIVFKVCGG